MRWLSKNAAWILSAIGLLGAGVGIYTRSALADVHSRIAVLEANRVNDNEAIKRIEKKVDEIHGYLLGGKK